MSLLKAPTSDAVVTIAAEYGIELSAAEVEALVGAIGQMAAVFDRLVELAPLASGPVRPAATRRAWRPAPDQNPLGAWYWRAEIREQEDGLLAGKTVAVKDSIA